MKSYCAISLVLFLFLHFAGSLVISNAKSLNKRAIPDLNGPPPEESEQEEAPLLQSSQTTTIQQQQQPVQPSVNPNPKRKSIFDSTECEHNKKCEHWKALSRTTKRSFQIYRWRKKLPEEERKRRSREQSQRYRKTITPQQKERRKQLAKINRKERMQTMPEDKREKFLAVKNIISKKYYHKNSEEISKRRRLKYQQDKEEAKKDH